MELIRGEMMYRNLAILLALTVCIESQAADGIPVSDVTLTYIDSITYSCERAGIVLIAPEEGDIVKLEDVILRLNDAIPQARLAIAQAEADSDHEVKVAQKQAEAAAAEYDAARSANNVSTPQNPAFSKTHTKRIRLNAEAAIEQTKLAEHQQTVNGLNRDLAQAELESYWVIAKAGGVVTRVFKRPGEGVQQGEATVQVVNTERLRIEGFVKVDTGVVTKGMPVVVTIGIPQADGSVENRDFTGKLGFVDVTVQELSKQVRVWADIQNEGSVLREGLPCKMVVTPQAAAAFPAN